jgi:hypothetical protein
MTSARLVKWSDRRWTTPDGRVEVSLAVTSRPPMIRGGGGVKTRRYTAWAAATQERIGSEQSQHSIRLRIAEWLARQEGAAT